MYFADDQIAAIVYEANRGHTLVIGDPWLDPPWPGLPQWRRDAYVDGVHAALAGLSPRQLHENWRNYYTALGWVHGPVKDPDGRPPTHPCLVPYDDVPPELQRKSTIFREFVLVLAAI